MLHLKESLRIQKWLNPALADDLILLCPIWDFSPTWTKLFQTRDYHASEAETSLLLHWCPEVVRKKIVMDKPAVAERLRDDPDSYQKRVSFTALKQEVIQTSQREDVKIGVMGYPERANAKLGAKIEAEFLKNAAKELTKAIKDADKARKSGKRINHEDNDKLKILAL
jgi:creatinine amidohydrolase/Fe(II)-dependent formamide hydrolase-like protein